MLGFPKYYTQYAILNTHDDFLKIVYFSLNITARFGIITIATEVAEDGGQVARALVSADTQKSIILHHK